MNILNLFNITKLHNVHVDFKRFLKLLTPEEQLIEINRIINQLNKSSHPGYKISKRFRILKELRILKKQIIHKDHQSHLLVVIFSFVCFIRK